MEQQQPAGLGGSAGYTWAFPICSCVTLDKSFPQALVFSCAVV